MHKNIQIGIALGIIFATSVFVAMAVNAGSGSSGSTIQTNPKIPSPPAPTLPAGFTIQQVQAAKDIETKELANITKNQTGITKNQIGPANFQTGNGDFFVTWPFVDTPYNVYSYANCIAGGGCTIIYPNLYLPLRIEVWDNIIYSDHGGYYPAYGADVWTYLYYWNYYTNGWTYENSMHGYTASAGNFDAGFIIPYKLYSDKYFTYISVNDGVHGRQWTDKFFTVNWY